MMLLRSAPFLFGRRALIVAFALALALACASLHPVQAQESYELAVDQVVVAEGQRATAVASVLDAAGRPVSGVTEFAISVDGEPVSLDSAEPVVSQEIGIAVVLAIDVSRSMTGEPFARAKGAAAAFVDGLLVQDSAGVVTFAGGVTEVVPFTDDHTLLRSAIMGLDLYPGGGTALYDAVEAGLARAVTAPTARRAVVLLTDGDDTSSARSREAALETAAAAGLPLFTIGLGEHADAGFLRDLAGVASGGFYLAPAPADVPGIFDRVGEILRRQYALAFELPESERSQRELTVTVEIDGRLYSASTTFSTAPVALPAEVGDGAVVPPWAAPAALLLVALLATLLGGRFLRRRLRRGPRLPGGPGHLGAPPAKPENGRPQHAPVEGRLLVVEGPNAGVSADLSAGPVDIGSAPSATLRLHSPNEEVAAMHARAWVRHKRLMLHHLARTKETLVGGKPVEWATLDPKDTFQIGQHVLVFELVAESGMANQSDKTPTLVVRS